MLPSSSGSHPVTRACQPPKATEGSEGTEGTEAHGGEQKLRKLFLVYILNLKTISKLVRNLSNGFPFHKGIQLKFRNVPD